jgi:hypothetical protein
MSRQRSVRVIVPGEDSRLPKLLAIGHVADDRAVIVPWEDSRLPKLKLIQADRAVLCVIVPCKDSQLPKPATTTDNAAFVYRSSSPGRIRDFPNRAVPVHRQPHEQVIVPGEDSKISKPVNWRKSWVIH